MPPEQQTKDSPVTYENWYLAQKSMKESISDIKKQITEIQAEQPEHIKKAVKEIVNGKIDRLQTGQDERKEEFADYIREDMEWKKNDMEWKKSVTPSIEIMKKIEGFSDTSTFLMKSIVLIGAVATAIYGLITWLKK